MLNGSHRLHALCPYFAMFPGRFARDQIRAHSSPGDFILDPFSGRGTTLLEGLLTARNSVAGDPNPVAYCLTKAKSDTPSIHSVLSRINGLELEYLETPGFDLENERRELPKFFRHAYYYSTLKELLFLRGKLRWRTDRTDCFIAGILLGSLHGEMDKSPWYLSNQMPRRISTKPNYSVKYWRERNLHPRKRKTFDVLRRWSDFRLKHGSPSRTGIALEDDARNLSHRLNFLEGRVRLVVTSPPYFNTTSFAEDQWLRIWALGGDDHPTRVGASKDDRHTSKYKYWRFLTDVWQGISSLLSPEATIVCRIGSHGHSVEDVCKNLVDSVRASFPRAALIGSPVHTNGPDEIGRQQLSSRSSHGELDLVLRLT